MQRANAPRRSSAASVERDGAEADAMAEVNVIVRVGPETYSGRGVSTDVGRK